jgi:alkylation response protein AidB-like acyl-CoA dehydrogenase
MGWNAQPTRQVVLDEVRVPASAVLGDVGGGFRIAMKGSTGARQHRRLLLGGAQWALDRAVRYVHERFTFGRRSPNDSRSCSPSPTWRRSSSPRVLVVRDAARAIDEDAPDVAVQCAMAKRFATDAGFEIANRALQLHGGYGYLQEYGIEKVVRDLRVHQILEGTNEIMRVVIGRGVVGA